MQMLAELKEQWDKLVAQWRREHRLAEEARVEGGTALFAIAQDTPAGDIQAATQRSAWANQIKLIEQKQTDGQATRADELLLRQLRRNLRDIDKAEAERHPTPENMAGRRLAEFAPVGQARGFLGLGALTAGMPWLAILGSPLTWVALGGALLLADEARIGRLHHDLTDAQGAARQSAQAAHTWEERAHAYEQATGDAQAAARITTATLEAERARARAATLREQRRQRDIAQVITGGPAPDWDSSLRNDPAPEDQSGPTPAAPVSAPR